MGNKSDQKKTFIIETAKQVFIEKGYKCVTMKDIVDACQISRGGLYLYYNSTSEIFNDVLKMEASQTDKALEDELSEGATVTDILMVFLKAQKSEILSKKGTLIMAIYEYYFENKNNTDIKKDNTLKKQFDIGVKIVEKLIETGKSNGEFVCEYPLLAAKNMMYAIEGMKIASQTYGISASTVDSELAYLIGSISVEEQ